MKRTTWVLTGIVMLMMAMMTSALAQHIDGQSILLKLFDAEGHVSYTAHQVTVLSGGPVITSEQNVYRSGYDGMRLEYTDPTALHGEIHADDGHVFAHLVPSRKTLKIGPSRLAELKKRTQQMHNEDLYAKLVGRDRIADRPAYIVEVRPNHLGRMPKRKLWVDQDKWVKLKIEELGSDGKVLSSSYYTKINYVKSIPESKFHIDLPDGYRVYKRDDRANIMSLDAARKSASFRLMEPTYLPSGFKAIGVKVIPFRHGQLVTIRYTDGVNPVSLFQTQQRESGHRFLDRLHNGQIEPGHEIYSWQKDNLNLTLIGQLSQKELHKIADSVK